MPAISFSSRPRPEVDAIAGGGRPVGEARGLDPGPGVPRPFAPAPFSLRRSPGSRSRRGDSGRGTNSEIGDQDSVEVRLQGQGPEVAAIIATRTALRVAPLNFRDARKARGAKEVSAFLVLTSAAFRASALARVAAKYPTRANRLNAAALIAAARASAAAVVGDSSDAAGGWAILGAASALAAAADASDAASASILAAPGFAAAADAAPTAIRLAAHADASFLAAYAAADPDLRAEIRFDSAAAAKLGAPRLADLRLWSRGPADWVEGAWDGLRLALPRDEGWDVWIDWYEDRLRGGSGGEAHELVFVSAPLDLWDKGPSAANAWIKEHLQKESGGSGARALRPLPGPS